MGPGYLPATRHPWPCLLFVLPLLIAYEACVVLFGGTHPEALRNGADNWVRGGFTAGTFVNNRLIGRVAPIVIMRASGWFHVAALSVMAALSLSGVVTWWAIIGPHVVLSFGTGMIVANANAGAKLFADFQRVRLPCEEGRDIHTYSRWSPTMSTCAGLSLRSSSVRPWRSKASLASSMRPSLFRTLAPRSLSASAWLGARSRVRR